MSLAQSLVLDLFGLTEEECSFEQAQDMLESSRALLSEHNDVALACHVSEYVEAPPWARLNLERAHYEVQAVLWEDDSLHLYRQLFGAKSLADALERGQDVIGLLELNRNQEALVREHFLNRERLERRLSEAERYFRTPWPTEPAVGQLVNGTAELGKVFGHGARPTRRLKELYASNALAHIVSVDNRETMLPIWADTLLTRSSVSFAGFVPGLEAEKMEALRIPELRGLTKGYLCSACGGRFEAAKRPRACPLCGYVPGVRETDSATIGIPDLEGVPAGVVELVTAIADHGGAVLKVDDRRIEFKGVRITVKHPRGDWFARHSLQWPKWTGMELEVAAG